MNQDVYRVERRIAHDSIKAIAWTLGYNPDRVHSIDITPVEVRVTTVLEDGSRVCTVHDVERED